SGLRVVLGQFTDRAPEPGAVAVEDRSAGTRRALVDRKQEGRRHGKDLVSGGAHRRAARQPAPVAAPTLALWCFGRAKATGLARPDRFQDGAAPSSGKLT